MSQGSQTEYTSRIDYAERRRERALARTQQSKGRLWLLVLAGMAVLLVLGVTAEVVASVGRIHDGVRVAGIDVGGVSPAKARAALEGKLSARASEPVIITHDGKRWTVTAEELGLSYDFDAAVEDAMEVGRDESILASVAERFTAWTRGVEIEARGTSEQEKLDSILVRIAEEIDVAPLNATVEVEGGVASAVPSKDGSALDRPALALKLVDEFADDSGHQIEAPVGVVAVKVTDEAAEQAAEVANSMLSDAVSVRYEKKEWAFEPDEFGEWLAFRALDSPSETATVGPGVVLEVFVDPELAEKTVTKAVGSGIGRPAKNASFKTNNGVVSIVPSQEGIGPDVEDLARNLSEELKDPEADRVVELHTNRTEPEITTVEARKMGIRDRIASYTTTYDSGNQPRVNNIHRLGEALNGQLIAPGGTFTFNGAAGQRTAEKGYQEANAIVNGKLVPQLGGGVCQVGTTIFNAVFESGLPVVERRNHSFYISHYPKGRDATVSWGGPDFKFKNDTEKWVLVSVSYSSSSITVALYGTDPGYDVEARVGEWTNVRPFATETSKDPTLESGTKVIEDVGVTGRSIKVERIVKKDGKVVRTDTFVSNYKPKAQVVRVGTKKPSSKPATSTP